MGVYVQLINIDTGETFQLGKLKPSTPPDIVSDLFKSENEELHESILCITGVWGGDLTRDKIRSKPEEVEQFLQMLGTFLIASRGQRLTLAVNPADEIMLDASTIQLQRSYELSDISESYEGLNISNVSSVNAFRKFISRRMSWIRFIPKTVSNGYMHKDIYQAYINLVERKTKRKFEYVNDYDDSDYDELLEWDAMKCSGPGTLMKATKPNPTK